jgi:hypothetical protein
VGGGLKILGFFGKIVIIRGKFRVFLENLGIRVKICNTLFKKCLKKCLEKCFVICPENFFSTPFM